MIKGLFLALAAVLLAVLAEGRREIKFFKMTRYQLDVPKLKALDSKKRLILLADLHNKVYGDNNDKLLRAIRREKPDIILIAGDMIVGKEETMYKEAVDFVTKLPAICPVYYGLGNHEQRLREYPEKYGKQEYKKFREKLLESGIHLLENESSSLMLDKLEVQIHGLMLPMTTFEKFKKHTVTRSDIEKCLGRAGTEKFQILIAHNPAFFPAYKEWGADLTVSGHLHGGIIRIPGLGGIITPQAVLFPKYSGEMTVENQQAIAVSKGLGTHTINLRFLNYAEVVVIDLV